jgi:hypothetical protein
MKNQIENLLFQVNTIISSYRKVAKVTGENFNIFKILHLGTSEVRLHSALIAELLDPNGSHENGNVFLAEFIKRIKTAKGFDIIFDYNQVKSVKVEHWLGNITDSDGGYIDILLTDKNNQHIIIENKIYAGDQRNQLLRYHSSFPSAPIIYLTLHGNSPSEDSTNCNKLVEDRLICLSYREDILDWLKDCKMFTVSHPLIRETLTQYINLIKDLTNQSMKSEEKREVVSTILQNQTQIQIIQQLFENDIWGEIKRNIMMNLNSQIFNNSEFLKNDFYPDIERFGEKEFDFWFYKEDWRYCIYFRFESNFEPVSYGIDILDKGDVRVQSERDKFKLALKNVGKSEIDDDWVWKSNFDEYDQTSWYDLNLNGGKLFHDKIDEIIKFAGQLMYKK